METDERFMQMALDLACKGLGRTSPNPMVGAVVVQKGEIAGTGFHPKAGDPHAEVFALNEAGERTAGATLYVTLEPCSHFGRTPPCADRIIEAGIARVVAAMEDPNPLVAGQGFQRLREAGVEVKTGVLEEQAQKLNEVYIKYITTGKPFVSLKLAMTLDGKIASKTGDSRWITGPEAGAYVHRLRDRHDALLVGIATVLADNPLLTTRLPVGKGRDPLRVVVDTRGRIPSTARLLHIDSEAPALVVMGASASPEQEERVLRAGAQVIRLPEEKGHISASALMEALGKRGVASLLAEGGGEVSWSLISAGLVDKYYFFIGPKIIGGRGAPTPVTGEGLDRMEDAWMLKNVKVKQLGADILITCYPDM